MIATPVVVGFALIRIWPSDWTSLSPPVMMQTGAVATVTPKLSVPVVLAASVPDPPLMQSVFVPIARRTSSELAPKVPDAPEAPSNVLRAAALPQATTERPNDVNSVVVHASEPVM